MIFEIGYQTATKLQRQITIERGDDSFCASLPTDFGPVPSGSKWKREESTGIALRMRYVEPHQDTWVGHGFSPKRYAALFWLIDIPSPGHVILQVGKQAQRMDVGDFVVFDDRVMHSVFATRTWRGCAYQLRFKSKKGKDQQDQQEL